MSSTLATTRRPASARRADPPAAVEPSLAEHVCLALITQGATHGWAVGSLLAADGEVGQVWHLTRPLTYRAIDGLVAKRLVRRSTPTAGQGRDRIVLSATAAGRRVAAAWLQAPVDHLRDVRTTLLVKLVLRERAGLDTTELLRAQEAAFAPLLGALASSPADDDLVGLWRHESARAVRRFLAQARQRRVDPTTKENPAMRLSARNQLRATVTAIQLGDVMATVHVSLGDGQAITAAITRDSAEELDLAIGDEVRVIIKSTEVMVAKE